MNLMLNLIKIVALSIFYKEEAMYKNLTIFRSIYTLEASGVQTHFLYSFFEYCYHFKLKILALCEIFFTSFKKQNYFKFVLIIKTIQKF